MPPAGRASRASKELPVAVVRLPGSVASKDPEGRISSSAAAVPGRRVSTATFSARYSEAPSASSKRADSGKGPARIAAGHRRQAMT